MLTNSKTYRDWLKDEFLQRTRRNPHYSLRAFARDLNMLSSRLSDVLNGKQGLSHASASQIASCIDWTPTERRLFVTMVESQHSRSRMRRERAVNELQTLSEKDNRSLIDDNMLTIVSDWYHFAIFELLQTEGVKQDAQYISSRLGVPEVEVKNAIDRLVNVGLLIRNGKNGKLIIEDNYPATTKDVPSHAIRKFHDHIIEKAKASLFTDDVKRRDMANLIVAIDPADMEEIKFVIGKFRKEFVKRFNKNARKKEVYCLSTLFFALSKPEIK